MSKVVALCLGVGLFAHVAASSLTAHRMCAYRVPFYVGQAGDLSELTTASNKLEKVSGCSRNALVAVLDTIVAQYTMILTSSQSTFLDRFV